MRYVFAKEERLVKWYSNVSLAHSYSKHKEYNFNLKKKTIKGGKNVPEWFTDVNE